MSEPVKYVTPSKDSKKTMAEHYPSPSDNETFKKTWDRLVPEVVRHENFKSGDLLRLETLCELYVEKENLKNILDISGYTYDKVDSKGITILTRPEVSLLGRVQTNILLYSKSLGLLLKETKEKAQKNEDDVNDWG